MLSICVLTNFFLCNYKAAEIPRSGEAAKAYEGKYTLTKDGQKKYRGWHDDAYKKYNELLEKVVNWHKDEAATDKPLQKYALKIVRAARGVEGEEWKKNSRKKRKAIAEPEEVPINRAKRADEDDDFFNSDTENDTEDGGKGDKSDDDDVLDNDAGASGITGV